MLSLCVVYMVVISAGAVQSFTFSAGKGDGSQHSDYPVNETNIDNLPKFWTRKMRSFFNLLDDDLDGVLTQHEFLDTIPNRMDQYFSRNEASVFKAIWHSTWDFFFVTREKNDNLTVEDVIKMQSRYLTVPHFPEHGEAWFQEVFKLVLSHGNQLIDLSDYTAFLQSFGVDPETAPKSFNIFDIDDDGYLDEKEYVKNGLGYFADAKQSSGRYLWGSFPPKKVA
ncbi:sarcoplasmic calcium-binding protein-like [Lingula anatina]|uniref:Sarcoplasmic calcium-binding protein-like n=1 Tax=Lingula anatina TaxID=7574 RepID=A0A1S3JKZ3_LINAN|nr:sarcoplasmic calcium-binding protein-like [Lingula anatina]|eukprot:XP_013410806.1 sarcoplasmic calcium-binding protein-like [Lingula anatina]